jgi:hypothetical protein
VEEGCLPVPRKIYLPVYYWNLFQYEPHRWCCLPNRSTGAFLPAGKQMVESPRLERFPQNVCDNYLTKLIYLKFTVY